MLCIGIDGGGTKTDLALCNTQGRLLARVTAEGCDYSKVGASGVTELLSTATAQLLLDGGHTADEVAAVCAGIPFIGEYPGWQEACTTILQGIFPNATLDVQNDVVVGMYGSLALEQGIHIVSGTGSIVFGCDAKGNTARAGGWHEGFSDEGSCYWLGLRTLELFFKQVDYRLERGPLYDLVREHFAARDDTEIIAAYQNIKSNRSAVAQLQRVLMEAAKAGDHAALGAYRHAAAELALCVKGVYHALRLSGDITVSYSGGLFHTGELILNPLRTELRALPITLIPPKGTPIAGALQKALIMTGMDQQTATAYRII